MKKQLIGAAIVAGLTVIYPMTVEAAFFDNSAVEPNDYVDDGPSWKELDVPLPALPAPDDLLEIEFVNASSNQTFIDTKTLEVGEDGITRVTLVSRHRSGTETVTREGIRCKTGEYRIYAIRNGEAWSVPKTSVWRNIHTRGYKTLRSELFNGVLCVEGFPKKPERVVKDVRYPPFEKTW